MPDWERKTGFVECDESSPPITSKDKLAIDRDGERGRKQISSDKAISSKPLARQALRPSVGWVPLANWGQSDRLALIEGSRYDSRRYDGLRPQA